MKKIKSKTLTKSLTTLISLCLIITIVIQSLFFYYIISQQFKEQQENFTKTTTEICTDSITSLLSPIMETSETFITSKLLFSLCDKNNSTQNKLELIQNLSQIANISKVTNKSLDAVFFISSSGVNYTILEPLSSQIYSDSLIDKQFIKDKLSTVQITLKSIKNNEQISDYIQVINPVFDSINYSNNSPVGYLVYWLDTQLLKNKFNDIDILSTSKISITDYFENSIVINNVNQKVNSNEIKIKIPKYNLYLHIKSPTYWVEKNFIIYIRFSIFVTIIEIIMICIILLILIKKIFKPIDVLVSQVRNISFSKSKSHTNVNTTGEIKYLSNQINKMLDINYNKTKQIIETQSLLYEAEIKNQKTSFYALQSQINPHFLYNTLQCIRGIALENNIKTIPEITTSMAEIFKYSIKGNSIVTFNDEIDITKKYFNIMNIRFDYKYKLNINIKNNLLKVKSIKLLLQPLIENSITHGFYNSDNEVSTININFVKKSDSVFISVIDDGVGLSKEKISELNHIFKNINNFNLENNNSIGLINVAQRLNLNFGNDSCIRINRYLNKTIVFLKIPL